MFSLAKEPITSFRGLQILHDHSESANNTQRLALQSNLAPGQRLNWLLQQIALRYGRDSASFVALQMEDTYPPAKE